MLQGAAHGVCHAVSLVMAANAGVIVVCGGIAGSGGLENRATRLIVNVESLIHARAAIVFASMVVGACFAVLGPRLLPLMSQRGMRIEEGFVGIF